MRHAGLPALALLLPAMGCRQTVPVSPPSPPLDPPPVQLVLTGPASLENFGLLVGSPAVTLDARVRLPSGAYDAPRGITYVSRDPRIVAVDGSGAVTGVSPGVTHVVARVEYGGRLLADSVQVGAECTAELRVRIAPRDTVIRVGESFFSAVQMFSCGGHVRLSDTLRFRSRASAVVQVDAATGWALGRAPGEAWIEVTGQKYGTFEATRVRVLPRTPN